MGMTMADRDMLPRTFQANVDRFYQRVILKTLGDLPTHETLVVGEASDMDEFLDRCAAQIDHYTVNEAAKDCVITLDGLCDSQLARWDRDRKSFVGGKGMTVRVDQGVRLHNKKKKK